MRKYVLLTALMFVLVLTLLLTSCAEEEITDEELMKQEKLKEGSEQSASQGTDYVFFTHNVHDWPYPEQSVESMHRLIDLHEEYNIPADLYFADPIFQYYVESAPDLVERFSTSEVVAVSYHLRPPTPYASATTWFSWESYTEEEQYEMVQGYEEHRLDLETGEYIEEEPGGYQFIKDTIGYAPYSVSGFYSVPTIVRDVYIDKGATFTIHRGFPAITYTGLTERPETVEFKWYDYVYEGTDATTLITESRTQDTDYIHIKIHDNNWHMGNAAFWNVYKGKPPYDLSRAYDVETYDEEYTEDMWEWYEAAMQVVAKDDSLEPMNLRIYAEEFLE